MYSDKYNNKRDNSVRRKSNYNRETSRSSSEKSVDSYDRYNHKSGHHKSRGRDERRHKRNRSRSRSREYKTYKMKKDKLRSKRTDYSERGYDNRSNQVKVEYKEHAENCENKRDIEPEMIEEVKELGYNSDEFVEMPISVKKKSKLSFSLDSEKKDADVVQNQVDPLDAFMEVVTNNYNELITQTKAKPVKTNVVRDTIDNDEDEDNTNRAQPSDTLESLTAAYLEEKRQKLPEVDHSRVYYRQCSFNLYKEVPEISNMTNRQVKQLRKNLELIVKGKDCPRPIKKWSHAITKQKLLQALRYNKMLEPTAIQAQCIPAIMNGRDVIGIAKTGSGKTMAYLLPLLRHISIQEPVQPGQGPIALILSPTRELTIQIYQEIEKVKQFLSQVRCCCLFGGSDTAQQIAKLKKGCEIVVATPGRMIDIMTTNNGRNLTLSRVTFIVLDEADRMFDLGFEPQVLAIMARVRPERQTVMFSATFPRKIEALARKIQTNTLEVRAGGGNKVCNDVRQHVALVHEEDKFLRLTDILTKYEDNGKILIFVEKQEMANTLGNNLNMQNYRNQVLHGGLNQVMREQALCAFRNGETWILIATSLAARGLDVNDLICVINYDSPNHYEDYVHRCGRTGRAGNKGDAYTFVTPDQEIMITWLVKALRESGGKVSSELKEAFDSYAARMKQEGKQIKAPSGFRGHGFKFDAEEAMREKEKRLKQLKKLCPDDITEEDEAILQEINEPGFVVGGSSSVNIGAGKPPVIDEGPESAMRAQSHARTAQQIAARLTHARLASSNADAGDNSNAIGGHNTNSSGVASPGGMSVHKEIPINHYPANIRYLLTTKELRTSLAENYDVSALVKGEYVHPRDVKKCQTGSGGSGTSYHLAAAPGFNGGPLGSAGANMPRPLHLVLEADSHMAISAAENEIIRVVREGLNKK